jgi:hypothetical protein
MSQPYGQQPQGGYNQGPGHGQQQPPAGYGQPGPGGPGYGGGMPPAPAEYTAGPIARPGGVTAAAVLAFVQAGITLICTVFALVIFGAVSSAVDETESQFGVTIDEGMLALGWIVAIAGVVGAGLLIWAGVKTMSGTAGKLMIIAAGLQILLCIVWFAALGGGIISIILLVMPVISLSLALTGPAKQYEASKRGQIA